MSASSDLHIETMNLSSEWTGMVAAILNQTAVGRAAPQKPDEQPSDEEEWRMYQYAPDLAFTPAGETGPAAVEIMMFRWRSNWLGRVSNAIVHMEQILSRGPYARGIIISTMPITPRWLADMNEGTGGRIQIWDLERLRGLVDEDNNELLDSLEDLAAETMLEGPPAQVTSRPHAGEGAAIAARLRATEPGPAGWQAYETICYEAIRFLFGGALQNLVAQYQSDDGLNRMDLIGRVRAETNSFWAMIAGDFASRYVVFEAKNSASPIGQQAIHGTAKYLMPKGLRKVAILLAREGATDNARAASAGYLRHDGFLMLVVSLSDLCKMLEDQDAGGQAENLLFERMDQAMMALNR